MKKKEIFIAIEIKVREYLSKIFLSFFLADKGFRVFIGSKDKIIDLVQKKQNNSGIFFYKGGIHKNLINSIDDKTDQHVVIDQEIAPGFSDKKEFEELIPNSFHQETLKKIDLYFSPNENLYKMSKRLLKKIRGKVVFTGWPRIDLWKIKYKFFYKNQIKEINSKYRDFILFNSDFGYVSENYIDEAKEYYPWGYDRNKSKQNVYKKYMKEFSKESHLEFISFIKLVKNFARTNHKQLILIRAHPSENLQAWNNNFKDVKNVKILSPNDDVTPWIYCAKCVLHRGCTTALQSKLINKPTGFLISNKKYKTSILKKKFNYDISEKIFSVNDLNKFIKKKRLKKNKAKIQIKLNKELGIREKDSVNFIIKEIQDLKCDVSLTKKIKNHPNLFTYLTYYKNLILKVILKILNNLGYNNKSANNYGRPLKIYNGITKHETKKYMDILNKNYKKRIEVFNFDDQIVRIEK